MSARIFAADAAILGNALRGLRAIVSPPRPSGFTYVSDSLWPVFLILLIVGLPPDAFVRHLLVPRQYLAWNLAVDVAAVASVVWLCGLFGSMVERPHEVDEGRVCFNRGLLAGISTSPDNLRTIEALSTFERRAIRRANHNAGFLTSAKTNVVRVDFDEAVALRQYPYLRDRQVTSVYVSSDRPKELVAALESARRVCRAETRQDPR